MRNSNSYRRFWTIKNCRHGQDPQSTAERRNFRKVTLVMDLRETVKEVEKTLQLQKHKSQNLRLYPNIKWLLKKCQR